MTTAVEQHTYEFRTADELSTCAGTLRYGDKVIGDRVWPVRFVVGGTGAVSCQRSTVTAGDGQVRFLSDDGKFAQLTTRDETGVHPLTVETRVDIEHVLNSVVGTVFGGRESRAGARATFQPTPEAVQACGEQGIRSLPFSATVLTTGPLFGLRSRTVPGSDTSRPRISRVRPGRRALRIRASEPATVVVGIRRGRHVVVRRRVRARAGVNRVRIRRLRRCRYRVTVRAVDPAGNRSRLSRRVRLGHRRG